MNECKNYNDSLNDMYWLIRSNQRRFENWYPFLLFNRAHFFLDKSTGGSHISYTKIVVKNNCVKMHHVDNEEYK